MLHTPELQSLFALQRDDRRIGDSNHEAHRELARAGIIYLVSGYATGPESHYRFAEEGWRCREELLIAYAPHP